MILKLKNERHEKEMTAMDGFIMFLFSMVAFFTLAMVAWFIIQQVLNDRKKEKSGFGKKPKVDGAELY